jgi:hypothetical protein
MDFDSGDGSAELKRALQRDRVDRIMEKYGVRPSEKTNYFRFLPYNIQEKDRPVLTAHFRQCLALQ